MCGMKMETEISTYHNKYLYRHIHGRVNENFFSRLPFSLSFFLKVELFIDPTPDRLAATHASEELEDDLRAGTRILNNFQVDKFLHEVWSKESAAVQRDWVCFVLLRRHGLTPNTVLIRLSAGATRCGACPRTSVYNGFRCLEYRGEPV